MKTDPTKNQHGDAVLMNFRCAKKQGGKPNNNAKKMDSNQIEQPRIAKPIKPQYLYTCISMYLHNGCHAFSGQAGGDNRTCHQKGQGTRHSLSRSGVRSFADGQGKAVREAWHKIHQKKQGRLDYLYRRRYR